MSKKEAKTLKRNFGTTMGITSIIAILVILVLVVFSTLSIITAKADFGFSEKTSQSIISYYRSEGSAVRIISEFSSYIVPGETIDDIDDIVKSSEIFSKGDSYRFNNSKKLLEFSVPMDNHRELAVEIKYNTDGSINKKLLWQVKPIGTWEEDNDMNLFIPGQ